ncbi:vWA domain-containing protein [Cerasicoccus frondis]|uniref:vWA domain-containing protein n=1 Tax=Cerasicoccus frondis TaxID=490090 RepID=UPI0028525ECC|nr:VWA domain-containing protein [Cerasicoccus frondis]
MTPILTMFSFGQPWWLLLLLLLPPLVWLLQGKGKPPSVGYSSTELLRKSSRTARLGPRGWLWFIRLAILCFAIIALARPRLENSETKDQRYGIDVVLVCDISNSMRLPSFEKNGKKLTRTEALIDAVDAFVEERPKDRTGLVGFAAHVYRLTPLTTDASWLPEVLRQIENQGGTAIGEGMLEGIRMLNESKDAESRVMIVVSDGYNTLGIDPVEAAELAREEGIRVHSIRITDFQNVAGSSVGQGTLEKVARTAGGISASATSAQGLIDIYKQIDRLEKGKIETKKTRLFDEIYSWPLTIASLLGLFELIAMSTFWIRLP